MNRSRPTGGVDTRWRRRSSRKEHVQHHPPSMLCPHATLWINSSTPGWLHTAPGCAAAGALAAATGLDRIGSWNAAPQNRPRQRHTAISQRAYGHGPVLILGPAKGGRRQPWTAPFWAAPLLLETVVSNLNRNSKPHNPRTSKPRLAGMHN